MLKYTHTVAPQISRSACCLFTTYTAEENLFLKCTSFSAGKTHLFRCDENFIKTCKFLTMVPKGSVTAFALAAGKLQNLGVES